MNDQNRENPEADRRGCADHGQLHCVIAAGDPGDLDDIRAWCAGLPVHTYGQVFVEVCSTDEIGLFHTPLHVGVTWICTDELWPNRKSVSGALRGQALATAVDAWLDEWIRADQGCWSFSVWMGARSSSIMRSYWRRIEAELQELWSHQQRS